MRGRKPKPGRRSDAPSAPDALPRCPAHLDPVAAKEWRRLARPLYDMGVLSTTDRAALAAYCQAWARWIEAEERLRETPMLIRTPSGYAQQSPWLAIANKQLEIMGRYMSELGLTPVARTRLPANATSKKDRLTMVRVVLEGVDSVAADAETAEETGRGVRVTRSLD